MNTRLFVGNLDYSTTEHQLRAAFEPFGTLVSVTVVIDRVTGSSRGFGFVEYETDEVAQRAIESLDGSMLDERAIKVNVARERTGNAQRGSRGGFRGGR
jgi:RNA recognition motif-containing protein